MNTINQSKKMERKEKLIIIDWLIEHFSAAFFKQTRSIKPLRIGIFEEINDFYNRLDAPTFSKKALRDALSYYCTSPAYLSCQKVDTARVDLFGNEVELVTAEQAKYAQQRYERQYLSPRKKTPSSTAKKASELPIDS
jgi:ProP effector|tara:strand:- start:2408 stop:2821 length:414 start_codon:yes stop_codon:yes gene_type:complete